METWHIAVLKGIRVAQEILKEKRLRVSLEPEPLQTDDDSSVGAMTLLLGGT
jgi:hypothetical protein